MKQKVDHVFPDCFPPDFQETLLPKDLIPVKIMVYRVCKYDKIDKRAFYSTFEEVERGLCPRKMRWEKLLKKPETYSTSCTETLEAALGVLDCIQAHKPVAFLIRGEADSELGPVRPNAPETFTDHVHWWLYRDADPSGDFFRDEKVTEI